MSTEPTFSLAACPLCSSRVSTERPFWRLARHTSAATGVKAYIFMGCKHANEIGHSEKIRREPEEWGLVEDAWAAWCEGAFQALTETWPEPARESFLRALQGRHGMVGATEALNLTPR